MAKSAESKKSEVDLLSCPIALNQSRKELIESADTKNHLGVSSFFAHCPAHLDTPHWQRGGGGGRRRRGVLRRRRRRGGGGGDEKEEDEEEEEK